MFIYLQPQYCRHNRKSINVSFQAYWRSCAALLGQVLETAFKDHLTVELLTTAEVPGRQASLLREQQWSSTTLPRPPPFLEAVIFWQDLILTSHSFTLLYLHAVTSGAFCCDVVLDPQLDSWTPSEVGASLCGQKLS